LYKRHQSSTLCPPSLDTDVISRITIKFKNTKTLVFSKICHKKVLTHPLSNFYFKKTQFPQSPHRISFIIHKPISLLHQSFLFIIFSIFFHFIDDIRRQSIESYTFCPCPVTLIMYIKDKRICEINFKK